MVTATPLPTLPPPPPSLPTTQQTPFPPLLPSLPLPFNQPPPPLPGFFPTSFPFPSSFGIFPFHSFCPPHSSTLFTPPPSDLPLQPPQWPKPTTTTSPTPLSIKLPSPISALKLSPQGREGNNGSFRIDSKTFSFSFDGGLADSYNIHECRWNIRSSVWMGRKGLEWILSCFADIRNWVPGKECLCKSYRVNNKFFEFRGRSNKAGIFVEIAMYYGGARRGWVMVPASSNQSGWRLFSKNLESFLVGSNTVWVKGRTSDEVAASGPLDGGGQVGKFFFKISNQRKLRKFEFSRTNSGLNVLKGDTVVAVSSINRRPMREFKFELTSAKLVLRVSKSVGGKCVATWMNPDPHHMSNNSGPGLLKSVSGLDKAHVVDQRGKAQREVSYPLDLGLSVLFSERESGGREL